VENPRIHLKLRSFFTLSLILYEAISKLLKEVLCFLNGNRTGSCSGEVAASTQLRPPLLEMGRQRQEQHHHRFRRPSDPDSRPHRLGSRTARNRFSLPLKPLPPPQLHKAEHDDADDAVQKPWNQRPRKPTLLPKATIKIGTGPSRNHHHATNNGEFHDGGGGGDNNNPAPKSLWLRGFSVKSGNFFFVNCLSVGSFLFYLVLVLVSYVEVSCILADTVYFIFCKAIMHLFLCFHSFSFVVEGFKKGFRLRETVEASIKSWVYTLYKAYS